MELVGVVIADGGRDIFIEEKCFIDRYRVFKNSYVESLMVFGIIAVVKGGGVLEFVYVVEREGGVIDVEDLKLW